MTKFNDLKNFLFPEKDVTIENQESIGEKELLIEPLHHGETLLLPLENGYLFVSDNNHLVKYRSYDEHYNFLKSLSFIEPNPQPSVDPFKRF